jgi:hypothetical protein
MKDLNSFFGGFFLLGTRGGQVRCLVFIRCRQDNCATLDASCRHTKIHPSMPSWINIHKLHDERFKHLSFLFVQVLRHSRGWEGCAFDWFTVLENNLIKLVSRVFFNNILRSIWMVQNSCVVSSLIRSNPFKHCDN